MRVEGRVLNNHQVEVEVRQSEVAVSTEQQPLADSGREVRLSGQYERSRNSMEVQRLLRGIENTLSGSRWRALSGFGDRARGFVDRPKGLRPDSVVNRPTLRPGSGLDRIASPRAESKTVTGSASPNAAIKDNQTVTSTINITDDVSIENLKLNLDLTHTYRGDLVVKLTSPSGKTVTISDRQGGSADDIKGSFNLSQFAGEKTKGTWKLTVEDKARLDEGVLKNWSLEMKGKPVGSPTDPPPPVPPTGEPVIVVLDGGVDYRHTDLDGSMWVNRGEIAGDGIDNDNNGVVDDVHGFNVGFNSGDPMLGDGTDHGTHVAGIIAAEDNGVGMTGLAAGKAKIMSIGGLYDGNDLLTNFERSVDYMVEMKRRGVNIRAVNASFGDEYRSQADQQRWFNAIKKLADADILLVAATANGYGSNMNNVPDFPANVDLPNVITVASMDRNNDKLARFSSYGDRVVELAAVGEDVLSTVPGNRFQKMSGTSMATPKVAATAALIFAKNPSLTAAEVRQILIDTVDYDPDLEGKVSTKGKLNTAAAVARA